MTTANTILLSLVGVATVGAAYWGEKVVSRQALPNKVTVVYWEKWTGGEGEDMRKIVDQFNASQDRIFVRYLSISSVDRKTMMAASGGDPPDVAGLWLEQVCPFSDSNGLTDLTEMAREKGLTQDYYIAGYWKVLNYRGKLWALPSTPASIALHVRPDLVPPEVASPETFPKTLEELDRLAERISTKNPDGSLKMAALLPSFPGWWHWAWPYYFGGRLMEGDRLTVNAPENVRAFKWTQKYAKMFGSRNIQSFQGGFGNFASAQDPFIQGKVAAELNGVWKANYIAMYGPKTPWFAVPFPYPADHPDQEGHAMLSMDILAIPRGAKHPKEAFEFIAYVQRQDVMEKLCSLHGKNSPLNKVSEEFFRNHKNKYIRLFDRLARSKNAFAAVQTGIVQQLNAEMAVAFEQVLTGQKEPQQALDDAQVRLEEIWATYQRQVLGKR